MKFYFNRAEKVPIVEIPVDKGIKLFIKREDLIHPEISGNKFWKLLYNTNHYLSRNPPNARMITFGGAYSNHLAATAALGKELKIETLGIVRGEEIAEKWPTNPTLSRAARNGMQLRFVGRREYRDQKTLAGKLHKEFPEALIIPEGGTNALAVEGIKFMLGRDTQEFDYLCAAVGTGGTLAGISKFAADEQKVLGFKAVRDDSLEKRILEFSQRKNFQLFDAAGGGYGRFSDQSIRFINDFFSRFKIPLEPVYTGKMFGKIFELISAGFFPPGSRILAFHTGGLQGVKGSNEKLRYSGRETIVNSER
jgi:1-aminocyclopropane-1-carboxylate deaminase